MALPHDELLRRIERDLLDSYDEELELEIEDRNPSDMGADLAKVMVASQQSQIAFRATVEVRNRLVQAYQDVMNMPL